MPLDRWKELFIAELHVSPNVSRACRAVGVSRQAAYVARSQDPEFESQWLDAMAASVDELEEIAFQRAKLESDTLAIFLLKCHRPEVYNRPAEQKVTVTNLEVDITPPALPEPQGEAGDGDEPPVAVLE